ncbi:hypothetical protein [Domibacillus antri]|uniref:hypothetical protein n=1 Tax=Domibacillus antri TaxID=1714264 RepID=UPI000B159D46|nr:hypothetical protein [Domibacillus antri]
MKPVFLHLHSPSDHDWVNKYYEFQRIPQQGEYVSVEVDAEWYEIELVVHTPSSDQMSAEVYAVKVDHLEVSKRKLNISRE